MAKTNTKGLFSIIWITLVRISFVLLILTPLFTSSELENGIVSGKYFWFYFSMGLVSITSVISVVSRQNRNIQIAINDKLVLLFAFCIFLFVIFSKNEINITKHILLILIIVLYFQFRLFFQVNKHSIYWLSLCFILTGLIEAIWGLSQLYGLIPSPNNQFRLTGSFSNPGPFACYIAIILPMAFYYTLRYRICCELRFNSRNFRIYFLWSVSILTFILSILILPSAMSRISWIAVILGCGFVLLYFFTRNKKVKTFVIYNKKKCILIGSVIMIFIVIGCSGMYWIKQDSADGRLFIWENTIGLIKQNPLGVGIGNFSGSYGQAQTAYFEAEKGTQDEKRIAGNPKYAFNEYLQICAEQGIIVLLLFIGIVGYSLYIGIKQKKIATTASLLALLIVACASYPFSILPFLIVLVFLLALINNEKKGINISKFGTVILIFCNLLLVSLCLYNRYPTYEAFKKWNSAKMAYYYGNETEAIEIYDKTYPLLSDQIHFLLEYAQCLSNSKRYNESNKVLNKAMKISCDPMIYNMMGRNFQAEKLYHCCPIKIQNSSLKYLKFS